MERTLRRAVANRHVRVRVQATRDKRFRLDGGPRREQRDRESDIVAVRRVVRQRLRVRPSQQPLDLLHVPEEAEIMENRVVQTVVALQNRTDVVHLHEVEDLARRQRLAPNHELPAENAVRARSFLQEVVRQLPVFLSQHVAEKRRGLIAAIAGIDVGSMLAQTTVKPTLKDYNLNEVSLIGSREDTIRRAISEVIRLIQSLEHR